MLWCKQSPYEQFYDTLGYEDYEERVEQYTPYLPAFSAAVLITMGVGFVTGMF